MSELLLHPGFEQVTPESAGWRYLSFSVEQRSFSVEATDNEVALVPLWGAARVEAEGESWELRGRENVFAGMPWALYLPSETAFSVELEGEVAVCAARCDRRREPVLVRPEDVEVEIRGAGNATRQINHIITPDFPADRLEVVEVYTPSGNWSSWPPHKHDTDDMPNEAILEEVYSYRFRRPEAWGVQRLYRGDGSRDLLWAVRDGETVIVTDGYHPFVATHGDDAYYLNALAGDIRTMACSFDPALDAVREAWASMEPDPRVPLVR
jgi:5-deoxy-glucuronate isomerase